MNAFDVVFTGQVDLNSFLPKSMRSKKKLKMKSYIILSYFILARIIMELLQKYIEGPLNM